MRSGLLFFIFIFRFFLSPGQISPNAPQALSSQNCNLGEFLISDTTICNGTSLNLQVRVNAPGNNGSTCFVPELKPAGNLNYLYTSTAGDAQKNVFHSAAFSGTIQIGATSINGIGGRDFFLVKYDSCGREEWVIYGGSAGDDDIAGEYGKGLTTDAAGNVYLTGRYTQICSIFGTGGTSFISPYTPVIGSPDYSDGFLVKISPAGAILWGATLRGTGDEGINGVSVDAQGNVIVTADLNGCCPSAIQGTVYGTTNSMNIPALASNAGAAAIIKFNAIGTVLWTTRIYNREAFAGGIACDVSGNVYTTGYFRSWSKGVPARVYDAFNNADSLFNPGIGLGYLIKINPNGAFTWGTTFGNAGDGNTSLSFGTGVKLDQNGAVWLSGFYSGTAAKFYNIAGSFISGPSSVTDRGFIVKYSPTGQALALNTLQQTAGNPTRFYGLACNGNEVTACGAYAGANAGMNDVLLAVYNLSASQQSVFTAGGAGEDHAFDIRSFHGNYLISGSAAAGTGIANTVFSNHGSWMWNAVPGFAAMPAVLWSTGATTANITVMPSQTTVYHVSITDGISTCTDSITVTVVPGNLTCYYDNDGDGFGTTLLGNYCVAPAGSALQSGDCNDNNPQVSPGIAETCNNIDDDCDGVVDNGLLPGVGSIQGPAIQCIPLANGTATFWISQVSGATSYQWSVPGGVSIQSGQGSNLINIQWTTSAAHQGISGLLSVTVSGACKSSTSYVDLSLQIMRPVRPSSISGPARLCPGDTVVYSVYPVGRARTYAWLLPAGLNILSGTETNIITVYVDNNFAGGALSVAAVNACGTGPARIKNLYAKTASTPGSISGPGTGLCGLTGVIYATGTVTSATGYTWTVPAGAQIISGQGSNSITVSFGPGFVSGLITVSSVNSCGNSTTRSLTVWGKPGIPGPITGDKLFCPGVSGIPYSIATVSGANTYNWTVFTGATIIAGQGSKAIKVDMPVFPVFNQNISVTAVNSCGSSSPSVLSGITLDTAYCQRIGITEKNDEGLRAYPNPTSGILYLFSYGEKPERIELYNIMGACVISSDWRDVLDLSRLAPGIYILRTRGTVNAFRRIELIRD